MFDRTCAQCGATVVLVHAKRATAKRNFCDMDCHTAFKRSGSHEFGIGRSAACKPGARAKIAAVNCSVCSVCFIARGKLLGAVTRGQLVQCSAECKRDHKNAQSRQYWPKAYQRDRDSHFASAQRRRAAQRGATVEYFKNTEIFERDGWACQLCGLPIDRDARKPDPLSVSLDHIVPISLGGAHSRANTQCAHLSCNVRKSNKYEGFQQLSLIA